MSNSSSAKTETEFHPLLLVRSLLLFFKVDADVLGDFNANSKCWLLLLCLGAADF